MKPINKTHSQYRHGHGSAGRQSPIYKKWSSMKRRCNNRNEKSYARYGGSGISVCEEWHDFRSFLEDMGSTFVKGLSLDRIDNSKGYSKENCRWVPIGHQAKNKTNVPLYSHSGETLNASDWDRKLGLRDGSVRARIVERGWSVESAVTTPKKNYKGVFLDNRLKFRVEVKRRGVRYFVGRYDSEKEAVESRKSFISKLESKN